MAEIPSQLSERLSSIFKKEESTYLKRIFSLERRPVSFRINTLKSNNEEIEATLNENNIVFFQIDFLPHSYILESGHSESDLWNLDIYKEGKIYLQWISSQFPIIFFDNISSKNIKILDCCAAPGGKTSQLSQKYPNAEIWAFEANKIRFDKMNHNLKKLWCHNVKAIHDSIENISKYVDEEDYFDIVLIDAPCSGEWALNINNTKFLDAWDISHIKKNYKRQKLICDSTLPYLKEWWKLIYSTCTLAPEENEWIIHYLLCHNNDLQLEKLDFSRNEYINSTPALKSFEKYHFKKEISEHCLRVIPNEYSEWFFIAKLMKWAL